jgi:hypothetical protein
MGNETKTETGTANTGKATRKPYKRSASTIHVLTPIGGDEAPRFVAGPFATIKKARASITEPGDYDIVCVREQVSVIQKTMTLVKSR